MICRKCGRSIPEGRLACLCGIRTVLEKPAREAAQRHAEGRLRLVVDIDGHAIIPSTAVTYCGLASGGSLSKTRLVRCARCKADIKRLAETSA